MVLILTDEFAGVCIIKSPRSWRERLNYSIVCGKTFDFRGPNRGSIGILGFEQRTYAVWIPCYQQGICCGVDVRKGEHAVQRADQLRWSEMGRQVGNDSAVARALCELEIPSDSEFFIIVNLAVTYRGSLVEEKWLVT